MKIWAFFTGSLGHFSTGCKEVSYIGCCLLQLCFVWQLPVHLTPVLTVYSNRYTDTCSPPERACSNLLQLTPLPCDPTGNLQKTINHRRNWWLLTNLLMQYRRDENDALLFHSACHLLKQTSSIYTVNKLQSNYLDDWDIQSNVHFSCVVPLRAADFITNISQAFSLIPRCW